MKIMTRGLLVAAMTGLAARGVAAQCCGDCDGDGMVAINELVTAVNWALNGCQDGVYTPRGLPATGQRAQYGSGSDGDVQAGAPLAYTDNGDGTITDKNTGLMWEKKDDFGGIHDKDNLYTWGMPDSPYTMDGTMVTTFLAALNAESGFAGYTDWRIPNVKELQSIVNYEFGDPNPLVSTAFNSSCVSGCTVDGVGGPMCSCTQAFDYWSSTTIPDYPQSAFIVGFAGGYVDYYHKNDDFYVRAVRGGL